MTFMSDNLLLMYLGAGARGHDGARCLSLALQLLQLPQVSLVEYELSAPGQWPPSYYCHHQ